MSTATKIRGVGWLSWAAVMILAGTWPVTADEPPADRPAGQKLRLPPSEDPPKKRDPFVIPQGSPAELLNYLDTLQQQEPPAQEQAAAAFVKKVCHTLVEVSDKILAAKPTAEQARDAARYKLMGLQTLGQLGGPDTARKIQEFLGQLDKLGWKDIVREVRGELLRARFERAGELSEEDFAKLLGETRKFIGAGRPDKIAANLAMTAATTAESLNRRALAIEAYQYYGKLLAGSGDAKLAHLAATLQGAARRLGLLGKEMTVAGTTLSGKPLDWSKYKGKVVLVDFWATWCGPCRGEIPNIAQNYEDYHDRGFDVVSISVDSDREALDGFLKENAHPWTVVVDAAAERGADQPLSTYYGIISIPQMMLIGRDGKVVATGIRGPELGRELEKLLGPAEGSKRAAAEKGAEKKGPAEK